MVITLALQIRHFPALAVVGAEKRQPQAALPEVSALVVGDAAPVGLAVAMVESAAVVVEAAIRLAMEDSAAAAVAHKLAAEEAVLAVLLVAEAAEIMAGKH